MQTEFKSLLNTVYNIGHSSDQQVLDDDMLIKLSDTETYLNSMVTESYQMLGRMKQFIWSYKKALAEGNSERVTNLKTFSKQLYNHGCRFLAGNNVRESLFY